LKKLPWILTKSKYFYAFTSNFKRRIFSVVFSFIRHCKLDIYVMLPKGHRHSKTKFATIFFDYKIAREIQLVIRGIKKKPPRKSIQKICEDRPVNKLPSIRGKFIGHIKETANG
jgi:hypothetical protein